MRNNLLFIFLFIMVSCSNSKVQEELAAVKKALAELEAKEPTEEGALVHIVFFKVKPDADRDAFIQEIKKLEAIKEVKELEVGPFEDLGDSRALSDYGVIMQMSFTDSIAYQQYQKHPIHLALKDNTAVFLAGPPATYDFLKK